MEPIPATHLTAYEVRHFVQPPALRDHDPIALLNEYLISEIQQAMLKPPEAMRAHLVSLYHYLNTKPEAH
jgi:hypothetical protein